MRPARPAPNVRCPKDTARPPSPPEDDGPGAHVTAGADVVGGHSPISDQGTTGSLSSSFVGLADESRAGEELRLLLDLGQFAGVIEGETGRDGAATTRHGYNGPTGRSALDLDRVVRNAVPLLRTHKTMNDELVLGLQQHQRGCLHEVAQLVEASRGAANDGAGAPGGQHEGGERGMSLPAHSISTDCLCWRCGLVS